jgi:hypothetical protein
MASRQRAYTTVAASSDLAVAVDEAQYADGAGPCLDRVNGDFSVAVPSIAATMAWPGFRDTAYPWGCGRRCRFPCSLGAARLSPPSTSTVVIPPP